MKADKHIYKRLGIVTAILFLFLIMYKYSNERDAMCQDVRD